MQDLPDLIPEPIEYTIGGRAYKFAPLTMGDMAALGNYIRQRLVTEYKAACDGFDPVIIVAGIESIINSDPNLNTTSPDAIQFLVWRSLSKQQPEIKLEDVGEMLSMANINEIMTIVNSIGGTTKN